MARPKKQLTDAEIAKMRDVEAYTHDDKMRTNNPPVGMAQHDKAEEKMKTYQFDPHLDPTLQWAGKAEGTSFEVPTYRHAKGNRENGASCFYWKTFDVCKIP